MSDIPGFADKEVGMQLALEHAPEWREQAYAALETLARTGEPFTADHLLEQVGLPNELGVNANNAVGAVVNKPRVSGLIQSTGRRVPSTRRSNHGRYLTEWEGT